MTTISDDALLHLDDYVRGQLPDDAVDSYEEQLFARALAGDASELGFRAGLVNAFAALSSSGTLALWLTKRSVKALIETSTQRIMQIEVDPARPSVPSLTSDFDILITRIPMALEGVTRLDAEVLTATGEVVKVMPEISFDPADGALYSCCERELAIKASAAKTVTRMWAVEGESRRLVVEIPM